MKRSWAWRLLALVGVVGLGLGVAACGGGGGDTTTAATAAGTTAATGAGTAEVELRLGYVTPPAHPYGQAVDFFAEEVATASGGTIAVKTLPTYGGGNDITLLNDVKGGAVEMASVSSAVWGTQGVTSFDALQMPFLITRYDLEAQVISGPIGKEMLTGTEELGLVGLAIHEGGLRKPLSAGDPLTSLADFKGLKIRSVESPVLVAGLKALGADPTPLPIGDVYNALKSGTVDAMEANLGLIQTFKLYEVAESVTGNVNFWPFPTVLVMNEAAFDELTPEQQTIITEAADKVAGFSIEIFTNPDNNLTPTLCEEGLKFASSTPAQLAALAQATEPVYEEFSQAEPETAAFIADIQEIKDGLPAPPAPAPLPEGCAAS